MKTRMDPDWEKCHIVIKFVEINEKDEEKPLGWYAQPLFKMRKPNLGNFNAFIYDEPIQVTVPVNLKQIKSKRERFYFNISMQQMSASEFN